MSGSLWWLCWVVTKLSRTNKVGGGFLGGERQFLEQGAPPPTVGFPVQGSVRPTTNIGFRMDLPYFLPPRSCREPSMNLCPRFSSMKKAILSYGRQ